MENQDLLTFRKMINLLEAKSSCCYEFHDLETRLFVEVAHDDALRTEKERDYALGLEKETNSLYDRDFFST